MIAKITKTLVVAITLVGLLAACGAPAPTTAPQATDASTSGSKPPVNLILGAYTTPREAYGEIIPLFARHWQQQTGQEVTFEESYLGSGAQARAINEGFEADVAALSL